MNASQGVLLIAFLFFSQSLVHTFKHNSYAIDNSFLQDNVLDEANELSELFLSELETFNNNVLEKLADRLVNVLNNKGIDMDSPDNVKNLYNFLQNAELVDAPAQEKPKSFKQKLLSGLKKAAKGIGREALIHATRVLVGYGVKEGMPELERIVKVSLTSLPVNLKVAIAPMVYVLFRNLFKKAKVKAPPGFSLKEIILYGLNEQDKQLALKYMANGVKDI
uniref:Uncharacterized protein n=1 Tax=Theileria annulata TaxID=5874 RepID=A0A3B0MIH6_THEAN